MTAKVRLFDDDADGGNLTRTGQKIQKEVEKLLEKKANQWAKKYDRHDLRHVVAVAAEFSILMKTLYYVVPSNETKRWKKTKRR